jgi:ribosomal-protein-alanine N-acetyltransferase
MLRDMTSADVDAVVRIEQEAHLHPWTHGSFNDAIAAGNLCKVAEENGELLGYVVLMPAVDEMQLLDIVVAAQHQCQGLGRGLLTGALKLSRGMGMRRMLLEVRPSNLAALALYRSVGFVEIGLRRGYYPAENNGREDAIVMELKL